MELTHRFSVPGHIDSVWGVFNNLQLLSPCFPGATVSAVDGDGFTGSLKVKFGAATMVYDGAGEYAKRDESDRRLVIKARAHDRRGNGKVKAVVTARLLDTGADTEVEVHTALSLTGKPAQLGTAVVEGITEKMFDQFAANVTTRFAQGLSSGQAPTIRHEPDDGAEADTETTLEMPAVAAGTADRPIDGSRPTAPSTPGPAGPGLSDQGPVDAVSVGGPVLIKRYGPAVLAAIAVLVALLRIVRRARR
jgi:carbon monoxide dehydrogenase subunit G